MSDTPIGPLHNEPQRHLTWEQSIWLSEKHQEIDYDHFNDRPKVTRALEGILNGKLKSIPMPYVARAVGLPPEFSDWEGRAVDFRFEELPNEELKQKAALSFICDGCVALKMASKWFMIRRVMGEGAIGKLEAIPIDDEQLQKLVRLPVDWSQRVVIS